MGFNPAFLNLLSRRFQDLESPLVPRICLALDTIIRAPFEDLVPAVQDRLYDILSHNSSVCIHCQSDPIFAQTLLYEVYMFDGGRCLPSERYRTNSWILSSL